MGEREATTTTDSGRGYGRERGTQGGEKKRDERTRSTVTRSFAQGDQVAGNKISQFQEKNRTNSDSTPPPSLFIADLFPNILKIRKKVDQKNILSEKNIFGKSLPSNPVDSNFFLEGLPDLKTKMCPKTSTELVTGLF